MIKYKVHKNFYNKFPSWSEIINNLNESFLDGSEVKCTDLGFFATFKAHKIPVVEKVMKKIKSNYAHLYVNFVANTPTTGRHKDTMDIKFWQMIGSSKWCFDDNEIILNEGDLIHVTKGTYHHVKPLTPRAGISFEV